MMGEMEEQRVLDAIDSVPNWNSETIQREPLIGGLQNSNWLIEKDGEQFVMKIPGIGTDAFIDRKLSHQCAVRAHGLGISPEIIFFSPETGVEVSRYLSTYRASTNADFGRKDFQRAVVDLYATFNQGELLSTTKDVFEMVDEHIRHGDELGVLRPPDFPWLHQQYNRARQAFFASGLDLAPCHNDPMPGNFLVNLKDDELIDMKLIDFEFSSNNERAYEVGVFFGEVFLDEDEMLELIQRYYGHVNAEVVARVWVARAVADMKWGSWAVLQRKLSDWDFDYQKYGVWKFARARKLFNDPRWNDWLAKI